VGGGGGGGFGEFEGGEVFFAVLVGDREGRVEVARGAVGLDEVVEALIGGEGVLRGGEE
jgi:hypothetical protein